MNNLREKFEKEIKNFKRTALLRGSPAFKISVWLSGIDKFLPIRSFVFIQFLFIRIIIFVQIGMNMTLITYYISKCIKYLCIHLLPIYSFEICKNISLYIFIYTHIFTLHFTFQRICSGILLDTY